MRGLRALARDRRGVALVEFAIILPVLLMMMIGGFTFANAMAFSRKLSAATRALADLTAQRDAVDRAALATITGMRAPIGAPFAFTAGETRISQVVTDRDGGARIDWSYAADGKPLDTGASYDLPDGMHATGSAYLVAEMHYAFQPLGHLVPFVAVPLSERVIMVPRKSDLVTCDDC